MHRQGTQTAAVQPTTFSTATESVSVRFPPRPRAPMENHGTVTPANVNKTAAAIGNAFHVRSLTSIPALVCAHRAHQVKSAVWTAFAASLFSKTGLCHMRPSQGRAASYNAYHSLLHIQRTRVQYYIYVLDDHCGLVASDQYIHVLHVHVIIP